ncbi:MAG: hypothetical protein AABX33_07965 [Nanoarchaeota archaeon]
MPQNENSETTETNHFRCEISSKFLKKSQLYSQIFIYILALVLISGILIFGYSTIQIFTTRGEQVACLKFKNDLSNSIESITSDFGSVKRKDLQLCSGHNKVCFVESFEQIINKDNPQGTNDPIIKDSIKSEAEKNVFLVGGDSYSIGKISVEGDVLCINAKNNQISLRLEGMGNHVLISEWGNEPASLTGLSSSSAAEALSITALPTANLASLRG